jgi:hypothetical protein
MSKIQAKKSSRIVKIGAGGIQDEPKEQRPRKVATSSLMYGEQKRVTEETSGSEKTDRSQKANARVARAISKAGMIPGEIMLSVTTRRRRQETDRQNRSVLGGATLLIAAVNAPVDYGGRKLVDGRKRRRAMGHRIFLPLG